jgi:hypothetical protein
LSPDGIILVLNQVVHFRTLPVSNYRNPERAP